VADGAVDPLDVVEASDVFEELLAIDVGGSVSEG